MDPKNKLNQNICEKIDVKYDIFYTIFTANNSCVSFTREGEGNSKGEIKVYLSKDKRLKKKFKNQIDIHMKFQYLRGDYSCIF